MNIILQDVSGRGSLNFGLKSHKKSVYVTIKIETKGGEQLEFVVDRDALIKTVGAMK